MMTKLPYTTDNLTLIQNFIDETRKRISEGVEITFTDKAKAELADLALDYDIDTEDIERALVNLTTDNYYRGINPSGRSDFDVCAFCTTIGVDGVQISL